MTVEDISYESDDQVILEGHNTVSFTVGQAEEKGKGGGRGEALNDSPGGQSCRREDAPSLEINLLQYIDRMNHADGRI